MDGEADSYRGVTVLFIDDGRDPIMALHEQSTGKLIEKINLLDYDSLEELTGLMNKYGFQKRNRKELERYRNRQLKLQEEFDVENERMAMEEAMRMKRKKDEIASRVLKMMNENLKKQQEGYVEIKV